MDNASCEVLDSVAKSQEQTATSCADCMHVYVFLVLHYHNF